MRLLGIMLLALALFLPMASEVHAQVSEKYISDPNNASDLKLDETINSGSCEALRKKVLSGGTKTTILERMMNEGGSVCPCSAGVWIERIIECFTSENYGLIPEVVRKLIGGNSPYKGFYNTLVYGTILLAVVLFGLNMTMGSLQSLPKDSMTLIFKIGGVILFFSQYETLYIEVLSVLGGLVNVVGEAAGEIGNICGLDSQNRIPTIWARWDCLFQKLTGFVGGYIAGGIVGYQTAWLFKGGVGVAIYFAIGYVLVTILLMAMRMVYNYLVAIIAVSFIYLLAPLFVPMIFFGQTYQKFATWFKLMLAYLLQPMFIILFSVLMLTALEFAIFVGPTSLYTATSGKVQDEAVDFFKANSDNLGTAVASAITGGGKAYTSYISMEQLLKDITQHTNPDVNTTNPNEPGTVDQQSNPDGTVITRDMTVMPAGSHEGGYKVPKINSKAAAANDPAGRSEGRLITDIMAQAAMVAILVFVLYNLVLAVPQITHDLVAQNLKGFGGVHKARMVGESEIRKSLEGAKEVARRGKESGDKSAAVESVLQESLDAAVSNRDKGG